MPSEKEKMLAGESYLSNDKQLVQERLWAKKMLQQINAEYIV
ncbi:MAG: maltose acetyltransferase domain-containing protein, partial [Flavobacterium sp.]